MKIVAPKSRLARWELGRCTSENDTDYIYVPLPKCASRYTMQILNYMCGWTETGNFLLNKELSEKKKIVVVRDPLERWLSGIVHHFHLRDIDMVDENVPYIFNQLVLDPHTELQVKYLEGLDTDQCVFFLLDDTYKDKLKHFIVNVLNKNYTFWNKRGEDNPYWGAVTTEKNKLLWHNTTDGKPHKKHNLTRLKNHIDNPEYMQRVQKYLAPDYAFIQSLEFYKGTVDV